MVIVLRWAAQTKRLQAPVRAGSPRVGCTLAGACDRVRRGSRDRIWYRDPRAGGRGLAQPSAVLRYRRFIDVSGRTSTVNSPRLSLHLVIVDPEEQPPVGRHGNGVVWLPMPNRPTAADTSDQRARERTRAHRSARTPSARRARGSGRVAGSLLNCTSPVALNVIRSPLRTVMPVSVQRWLPGTRICPPEAGAGWSPWVAGAVGRARPLGRAR